MSEDLPNEPVVKCHAVVFLGDLGGHKIQEESPGLETKTFKEPQEQRLCCRDMIGTICLDLGFLYFADY